MGKRLFWLVFKCLVGARVLLKYKYDVKMEHLETEGRTFLFEGLRNHFGWCDILIEFNICVFLSGFSLCTVESERLCWRLLQVEGESVTTGVTTSAQKEQLHSMTREKATRWTQLLLDYSQHIITCVLWTLYWIFHFLISWLVWISWYHKTPDGNIKI